MARAVRWLKRGLSSSSTDHTSTPLTSSMSSTSSTSSHTSQDVHVTPTVTPASEQQKTSVAILPFRNLSNDASVSFYEFSLADAVITELARLRSLVVRPSSMIMKYQGKQLDPRDAGRELDVRAVLAASFLRAGDRLRVTAQLLDVATGDLLWSDRIDAEAHDIIALQDIIAQRIVDGLRLELSPEEQAELAQPATGNAAAYEEYLRGRDLFSRFIFRTLAPEDCDAAIDAFPRAPSNSISRSRSHTTDSARATSTASSKVTAAAKITSCAEAAFNQALALDPLLVEARMLMVFVFLWRGEKRKARAEVARFRREAAHEAVVYFVKGLLASA